MKPTDTVALIAVHLILAMMFLVSIAATIRNHFRKRRAGANAEVERGEQSMNALFVMYGASTVIFSLAVEVADTMIGNKSTVILIDYLVLSYLFFFNSWFRNAIAIRTLIRMKMD
jgi:hypothetical protein